MSYPPQQQYGNQGQGQGYGYGNQGYPQQQPQGYSQQPMYNQQQQQAYPPQQQPMYAQQAQPQGYPPQQQQPMYAQQQAPGMVMPGQAQVYPVQAAGAMKPWQPTGLPPAELNEWKVGLCSTCCDSPGGYIATCFCTPCYVYGQREKILQGNWDDYVCCNNVCYGEKVPCQHDCPQCCMWCEACCCVNCSIHGNRNYLLTKYYIKDSCIEKCFLHCCAGSSDLTVNCPCKGCADCLCQQVGSCIPCCPSDMKNCTDCLPENCECTCPIDCVSACFLTQHNIEMEYRGYPEDKIGSVAAVPMGMGQPQIMQ